MTEIYGPQTHEIEALLERARRLTDAEAKALKRPCYDARDAAWYTACYAARYAACYDARDAVRYAARDAARYAVWDAAHALVVRDLIGNYGFTQQHYDMLTGPWRQVISPIHPDDADLRALLEGEKP